jgi:3-mercaptopyruvate sulfurtransferase SseA
VRVLPGAADLPPIAAGRDVVVYDSDPGEIVSAPVAASLIARGVAAAALKGGIGEWMAAGYPTEPKNGAAAPESPVA